VGRKENELNRENASLEQIETAMDCARTQEDYKRLVVIDYLYRGYARPVVEDLTRFAPSTVRKLIALFNARGIDGVVTKPRPGRPRKVPHAEFTDRVVPLLESPQEHGFSYMTVVKLHGHLTTEMRYEVSYSSVLRYVHSAGFSLKVPRRSHPDQDQERRKEFVEELNRELGRRDTEVWFSDETGIEGDPRTGRAWFKKGSKPTVPYDGCHLRQSIIGAVQPESGALETLAVPYTDTDVFQIFLDQLAKRTATSKKRIVLVVDNASWHHAAKLDWHHIIPMYLPAYSPDLNPIERLWLVIKGRFFTNWFTRDPDKLLARVCDAIKSLVDTPAQVSSICSLA
jgi:transposase